MENWKWGMDSSKKSSKRLPRIEELRIICCEETDRARQARIDELLAHQEKNRLIVSQLLTQIKNLQNKVNSLSDAREFYESRNSEQLQVNPRSQSASTIPSPRTMPCRDSGLSLIHAILWVLQETFFERQPARKRETSTIFDNSKNLACISL